MFQELLRSYKRESWRVMALEGELRGAVVVQRGVKARISFRGAQFLSASGPMGLEFVVQLQLRGVALFMLIVYEN